MVYQSEQFASVIGYFFGSLILTFHFSFRSVRNFVIDVRRWNSIFLACNILHPKTVQFSYRAVFSRVPAQNSQGTGLHWQVSQATSLINIVVHMSTATNTAHQGIFMENGRWATEHPSIHEFDIGYHQWRLHGRFGLQRRLTPIFP